MVNAITSRNGRLEVGMTRESLQQRIVAQGMSESDRAAKKLLKAFEMADGLGDEGVKDGVISEKEIEAYDKEMRKKGWITGLSIAGGVVVTAATAYLATKGIKANKATKVAEEARKTAAEATKAAEEARKTAKAAIVPSLGDGLSYGKRYYGVDTNAKPTIRRFTGGIERRYPCKDGGELVVTYVRRGDKSSSLGITKVGNPKDKGKGDWYRHFYSEIAVRHYKDRFGDNVTKTVKKKGAIKQVLSCANGKITDDVHVPLKRWELVSRSFKGKVESNINPWNPRDFDRFCD